MSHSKRPHHPRLRSLFLWHRYLGLTAAAFVIVIAVTGLLLNHTAELALDQRKVSSDTLLNLYGIPQHLPATSYAAGTHWLIQINDQLYLDRKPITGQPGKLHGAIAIQGMLAAAVGDALLLLTPDGQLIERQSAGRGLPCAPAALGRSANEHAVLRCQDGAHYHSADLLDWQTGAVTDTAWSQPATPAAGLMAQTQRQARHSTLDLERTLLDLHSGRLFGSFGVIVYDLAAILMLLLAITGVWHWARRKRK